MMMRYIWFLVLAVFFIDLEGAFAQQLSQEKKLVQFSGIIHNATTGEAVPYVTLVNLSYLEEIHNANHQGFFSFAANVGDTIKLSAVGYDRAVFVVPQSPSFNVTTKIDLVPHVIDLPVVDIYPWASVDEFTYDFMNLQIADDDFLIAQRNLSYESIAALKENTPMDAIEMQNWSYAARHHNMSIKNINQRMANPLLNPFAWGSLIQQISKGKSSRSNN